MPIYNLAYAVVVFLLFCLKFAALSEVTLAAKLSCHCSVFAQSSDGSQTSLRKMKTIKVRTPSCYVPSWISQKTLQDYQCHIAETKCARKCRQKANEVFYRRTALETMNKKILKKTYVCKKIASKGDYTLQVEYNTCKQKYAFTMDRILC